MPLHFRKALVTGASRGIGEAIAEALEAEGVEVYRVLRQVPLLGDMPCVEADLLQEEGLLDVEGWIEREKPDLLVNAAGLGECVEALAQSDENFRRIMMLNFEASRRLALKAAAVMAKGGAVVNVSSMAVDYPLPYMAAYNASKAALSAFTISMSDECRHLDFIDLRPGDINTSFARDWLKGEDTPAGRTREHQRESMAKAPSPAVVARALIRKLRKGGGGTLYAGSFFQAVVGRIGRKVLPSGILTQLRRKLFLR